MSSNFLTAKMLNVSLGRRDVLHDISLGLPRQHLLALVGPNGAGKTTLLKSLAGLVPARGTIEIDGASLERLPMRERARRLAYLPQGHTVHWPLAVRDVVALGRFPHGAHDPARLTSADQRIVEQAMETADVQAFADRRVTELSGGERSRVALARVLAVQAPVLLADEPTASLDPRHQLDVMLSLRKVADSGVLVIVITHDLSLAARHADTVAVLSEGLLVAHAPPHEALADRVLADVFRVSAYRSSQNGETIILPWSAT